MVHLGHPLPTWTRLAWPFAIVAPLLAAVLAGIAWIPSWSDPVKVFTVSLSLAGVTAAIAYAFARIRSVSRSLSRGTVASLLVSLGLLLLSVAVTCLGQVQIFPPSYAYTIDAGGHRAYVYNTGFLEREVTVRVQMGPFPVHAPLLNAPHCANLDVELDADGRTLHVCGRRCDLHTRRCDVDAKRDPGGQIRPSSHEPI
jgi:hypothetical protein